MDDASQTVHDKRRDGEFLLIYLTRAEVHYLGRLARWQLRRVAADQVNLADVMAGLAPGFERDNYQAALDELDAEADCLTITLRELQAAWRRPTVPRDS